MNTAWAKKTNVTNFTTAQHSLRCRFFYADTALTTIRHYVTCLFYLVQILRSAVSFLIYKELDFSSTALIFGLESWDLTKIHVLKEYNCI